MLLTQVLPVAGAAHDVSTDAGREWLADVYAAPAERCLRLNMITALTGAASGEDGTSDTLTNRVDRAVLGAIRAQADAVLVGAASVRAEGYIVPRRARLAVLTTTGDLSGHRLGDGEDRVVLVCPADLTETVRRRAQLPGASVIGVTGATPLSPGAILDALAAHALQSVVCEGGPAVAGLFASAGLVDEYCITVAPVLRPADRPFLPLPHGAVPDTEVTGMLVDADGFSYLRLRPRRPAPAHAASA